MKSSIKNTTHIRARIHKDLHRALVRMAEVEGKTMTQLLREIIEKGAAAIGTGRKAAA